MDELEAGSRGVATADPPQSGDAQESTVAKAGAGQSPGRSSRVLPAVVCAVLVPVLAVLTVLRYSADFLNGDTVMQSVASIQDVDLFYWGQDRLASVVSLLASPIADPAANLFAVTLLNALSFYGMLLVIARAGVRAATEHDSWWATLVLFCMSAVVFHALVAPQAVYVMALEAQPYSLSYLLTVGAYLLWRRGTMPAYVAAAAAVVVATGLNQSAVLAAAALAVVEMVRRRQWARWPVLGVVWLASLLVWAWLAARFGGDARPTPDEEPTYFSFSAEQLAGGGAVASADAVASVFDPLRVVLAVLLAAVFLVLLEERRRAAYLRRAAFVGAFAVGYAALFAGNPWVSSNLYGFRYFFPVIVVVCLGLAVPAAALVIAVAQRSGRRWGAPDLVRGAVVGGVGAALVGYVALAGPLRVPADATVMQKTEASAQRAALEDVTFVSGFYWDVWPVVHHLLDGGRTAAYGVAIKSGGDPGGYRAALERELAEGDGPPRAICLNETSATCLPFLDHWTAPGWVEVSADCPIPPGINPIDLHPQPLCEILEYRGPDPLPATTD